MKKCLIVFLMLALVTSFVFAAVSSGLTDTNNKATTNLVLDLDGDAYQIGFSESYDDYTHVNSIDLIETIDNSAMTVSLQQKVFYLFYKAITDDPSVTFKVAISPLYLDGTTSEDASKRIDYKAEITKKNIWNGANFSSISLETTGKTTDESTPVFLKNNEEGSKFSQYYATGIAEVVISSTVNLGTKTPGTYKGTITVTLSGS